MVIDWSPVEDALAEQTPAGTKLALLEAGKLLEQRLQEEKIPGSSLAERITAVSLHLTAPSQASKSVAYIENLRHGVTGPLQEGQGEKYIQVIRQAITDLSGFSEGTGSWFAKAKLYLGVVRTKQRWLIRGLAGVGGFFLMVLILADTGFGRTLVGGVVGAVNTFFSWIITLLILLALLVLVVLGTAVYLDRRGGRATAEDE